MVLEKAGKAAEEERRKSKAEILQLQVHDLCISLPKCPTRDQTFNDAVAWMCSEFLLLCAGSGEGSQVLCCLLRGSSRPGASHCIKCCKLNGASLAQRAIAGAT